MLGPGIREVQEGQAAGAGAEGRALTPDLGFRSAEFEVLGPPGAPRRLEERLYGGELQAPAASALALRAPPSGRAVEGLTGGAEPGPIQDQAARLASAWLGEGQPRQPRRARQAARKTSQPGQLRGRSGVASPVHAPRTRSLRASVRAGSLPAARGEPRSGARRRSRARRATRGADLRRSPAPRSAEPRPHAA